MKPPDMLKFEHRQIGRALKSLLNICSILEHDKKAEALLNQEVDFLTNYLQAHHQKEEEVFFPILREQLVTMVENPLPQLIKEHEQNKAVLNQLIERVRGFAARQVEAQAVTNTIRQLVYNLIKHMRKENTQLVKLYEQRLPANKKIELAERLELFDEQFGVEKKAKYEHLAADLFRRSQKLAA